MTITDSDLVLFGGGGDLAMRKLLPALSALDRAGDLPPTARIICVGRHDWTLEQFLRTVDEAAKPYIPPESLTSSLWDAFCARFSYVSLDAADTATYQALVDAMRSGAGITRVFYLATPPT